MPIETILMIVALIAAILVLAIGLRPPPLYSDKERLLNPSYGLAMAR